MRIGLEIEFTGVYREIVATALGNYFGNKCKCTGYCDITTCTEDCNRLYDEYKFTDMTNKIWTLSQDVSIKTSLSSGGDNRATVGIDNHLLANELQTPVLDSDKAIDLEILHDVLMIINAVGGAVNDSCAVHIHIDMPDESKLGLYLHQYVQLQYAEYKLFDVSKDKISVYAKPYTKSFDYTTFHSRQDIYSYIRSNYGDDLKHFNINFGACDEHGTIEFRAFDSTLNYDRLMSYVKYVLDFVNDCEREIINKC